MSIMSRASSAEYRPFSASENLSLMAHDLARIWSIRLGYCDQGPCLPHSFAFSASSLLKVETLGAWPLRITVQVAVWVASSNSS